MKYLATLALLFCMIAAALASTKVHKIKKGKVHLIDVPIEKNDILYDILFDKKYKSLVDKTANALRPRLRRVANVWTRNNQKKYDDLYSWYVDVSCDSVQEHLKLFDKEIKQYRDALYDGTHSFAHLTLLGNLCDKLVKRDHIVATFNKFLSSK